MKEYKKLKKTPSLQEAYKKAKSIHKNHLFSASVKMPVWGSAKSYWLAILIYYSPEGVTKDKISNITREHKPNLATDQQVRHLKRDGWNLIDLGKGTHSLPNPKKVNESYELDQKRKEIHITAENFEELKKEYDYTCLTCGAKEGEKHRLYKSEFVKLQRGHKDPEKSLRISNIIPQCQFCNRSYKNDFTFDDKGRVRAVASPSPVIRASDNVIKKVFNAILEKYKKEQKK